MKKLFLILLFAISAYPQDATTMLLLMGDGVSFLPSDIPNLGVWIDPAGEYVIKTGTAIDSVLDRSGNGENAVQTTGANRPIWYADSLNGLPAMWYDGTNDGLLMSTSMANNVTLFIVVKAYQNTGNGRVLGDGSDTRGIYTDATNYLTYNGSADFGGAWNVWAVLTLTISSNTGATYYNNVAGATGDMGASVTTQIRLGQDGTPQKCIIAEFLKYDRVLTADEITQVNDYLNTKYAIY